MISPEMQGNKKLIFLRKSSQSDRPLEKGPTRHYCLKSGAVKYKKFENDKKNCNNNNNQDREALYFWKPVTKNQDKKIIITI